MKGLIRCVASLILGLAIAAGCSDMIAEQAKDAVNAVPAVNSSGAVVEIYTPEDLDAVRNDLSGNYIVMADIDLSGYASGEGWIPIGDNTNRFTGTLDGNGRTISNLTINRSVNYQGLFGCIDAGGTVRRLVLEAGTVDGGSTTIGLLAGSNDGTISGCAAAGTMKGGNHVGGLVGDNGGTIYACYAAVNTGNAFSGSAGGLVGYNVGIIHDCYAAGAVTCEFHGGGLVGWNTGTILRCYATGSVNVFSNGGGLVGLNDDTVSSSYFYQTPNNGIGTFKTIDEMKLQSTYSGWDFTAVWAIDGGVNGGFPYLRSTPP